MVLVAYLAGVCTPLAAVLGGFWGAWWWRRLRRAQSVSEPMALDELPPPTLTPQAPEDAVQLNRMRYRSVPGRRRSVRGRRPQ